MTTNNIRLALAALACASSTATFSTEGGGMSGCWAWAATWSGNGATTSWV